MSGKEINGIWIILEDTGQYGNATFCPDNEVVGQKRPVKSRLSREWGWNLRPIYDQLKRTRSKKIEMRHKIESCVAFYLLCGGVASLVRPPI